MHRALLTCLLAATVIFGALNCSSSEPGPESAQEPAKGSTAALQLAGEGCKICLNIKLDDYNLFLLEDYSGGENKIQGKVAAGGNITMSDFTVGFDLPADNVSNTMVAGGNLTLSAGTVYGDTWYGGSSATGVQTQRGPLTNDLPSDFKTRGFAARFAELRALSSQLAALSGQTRRPEWGVLNLKGEDPCLNVFEVTASDFNDVMARNITAPPGSFTVVNIRGTASTPLRYGFNVSNPRRVIYNFVDATSLDASDVGVLGTVLAPHARVTFNYGSWTGGLYAVSLTGKASGLLGPLDELKGGDKDAEETCNGMDDNCNDQVDETFACTGSGTRSCEAWCGAAGTQACDPDTCGYGECTSSSCCRADADCASDSYCEGKLCAEKKEKGDTCGGDNQCASGKCVDGVCCDTACEGQCDACNLEGRKGTCSLAPSTVQCRASGGECDKAEFCTGEGTLCPADSFQDSDKTCTQDSNACTLDVCDGTGGCAHPLAPAGTSCGSGLICSAEGVCGRGCLIDGTHYVEGASPVGGECQVCDPSRSTSSWSFKPVTTQCRAKGGECDKAEFCTGSSATCPADDKLPDTVVCRPAAGVCDVAESCTGSSDTCPEDGYASDTRSCGSAGECEIAAHCTGTGPSCPANGAKGRDVGCTDDGNMCTSDVCDGAGGCSHPPVPAGTSCGSGLICNASGVCGRGCMIDGKYYGEGASPVGGECQVCNPSLSTTGWSFKPATTQCRAKGGECGLAEFCTGSSAVCPPDRKEPATKTCRPSTGGCDVAESCTGSSDTCPRDEYASNTRVCGSAGECEVAARCTGTGPSCPANGVKGRSESCSEDGNVCTSDMCNGSGSCSHSPVPAGTPCGSGLECNASGACVASLPPNTCLIGGVYYAGGSTNPSGACQVCDPSRSTSSWSFKPASTQCRASAGLCDAAEFCTGSSATCPGDSKKPSGTLCHGPTDSCDVPAYCTGSGNHCVDGFAPKLLDCRIEGGTGSAPFGTACNGTPTDTTEACNGLGTCIVRQCNPLTDKTCFLKQSYRDVLGRKADSGGLAYWLDWMNRPGNCVNNVGTPDGCWMDRAIVLHDFMNSSESRTGRHPWLSSGNLDSCIYQKAFIKALYYNLLQRRPEITALGTPAGIYGDGIRSDEYGFWMSQFAASGNTPSKYKEIIRDFINNSRQEYQSRFPNR
jgi:choice-of-anchor A domain-containing protein